MTAKGGIRDVVRTAMLENLGLKILSILCALAFYAFIHGSADAQRTISVSVVAIMPPDAANRQLMTPVPDEVKVTLRGTRTQLDDLRPDNMGVLQLDLRSGSETRIDLDPSMFHVPVGLVIEQMYPSTIELRWDDIVERQIPVQIARTGEHAPGLTVRAMSVEPSRVDARGPASIVEVIQFARAAPFDVTGLTEGVHERVLSLDRPPKLVIYSVESVTATVELVREVMRREFGKQKVEVVGLPRATTSPPFVRVVVRGAPEEVNALLPEALVPRVEPRSAEGLDTTQPGSAWLPVLVEVPPQISVETSPPKVLVKW